MRATGRHGCLDSVRVTARGVAFVTTRGPSRGKAEIWLDGRRVVAIGLYATSARAASIVWTANWGALETHRVQIVVLGTKRAASRSTRVDIDAFVVLR